MKYFVYLVFAFLTFSCGDDTTVSPSENDLATYLEVNADLTPADIIACAGGKEGGLFGVAEEPSTIFFYPIEGATDFRYFEAESVADSMDFEKYIEKDLTDAPIFNGYLWKFNNQPFSGERMGIVTYNTPGNLHTCTPIRLKANVKPTEVNPDRGTVVENGVSPTFTWEDGLIDENVIYFQVISDEAGNLISGTYTYEKEFVFYDTSNVVLNITNPASNPSLEPNQNYKFTMMGVSEDNWVNLLIEKEFITN